MNVLAELKRRNVRVQTLSLSGSSNGGEGSKHCVAGIGTAAAVRPRTP